MNNNDNLILNVNADNRYLYKHEDMQSLVINTSAALDDDGVQVTVLGSGTIKYEDMNGSFQNYLGRALGVDRTEDPFKISASFPEITLDKSATCVTVTSGNKKHTAHLRQDKIGLNKLAAPHKTTFKSIATRFELGSDDVTRLCNSFDGLYNPEKVYQVTSTDGNAPFFDYLNKDSICGLAGLSLLRSGGAISKHKNIKLFKLKNGISFLLDGKVLCSITEATPKYEKEKRVYIKQCDPETQRIYLEPCKLTMCKGFNPTFKQYAYNIVTDAGNEIYDVPESDITLESFEKPEPVKQEVPIIHF